ncbi:DUF2599 domain-containing protein [Phytoactinopolyspora mesophila]|uniref:DUF2599 domain-containing protein n=1 Tax=Phytoactinopolyspora mesophila TaxID=2650750 RepID=A0A7K3M6B8_9ACTN|nr:DUF2599 domain-containing protein [Phytoactinopolyspora mesophila]NDL58432.1 DUF2599 domain-containing protein [Phytoactinopolyspora mesophila]
MKRYVAGVAVAVGVLLTSPLLAVPAHGAQGPAARPDPELRAHVAVITISPTSHAGRPGTETNSPSRGEFIDRVEWIPDPNGRRLAVYPTGYARYDAPASEWPSAWAEVIRLEPEADHVNMRDQFRCHVEFARIAEPEKPSWNLELWRPDAGYLATVLTQCNP